MGSLATSSVRESERDGRKLDSERVTSGSQFKYPALLKLVGREGMIRDLGIFSRSSASPEQLLPASISRLSRLCPVRSFIRSSVEAHISETRERRTRWSERRTSASRPRTKRLQHHRATGKGKGLREMWNGARKKGFKMYIYMYVCICIYKWEERKEDDDKDLYSLSCLGIKIKN